MPLVDAFGREITYLRISVTDRCNLRCTYCMPENAEHVDREDLLRFEEIDRLVGVAAGLGWRKVRLTGGEPLVRKDVLELVDRLARRKVAAAGERGLEALVMTSNGLLLARHARALARAGLDRVNVSLDTLDRERFRALTRFDRLPQVLEGIDAAVEAGLTPLKLNTVLVKGSTDDELPRFLDLARTRPLDIRFIEFMPFGGNGWSLDQVLPSDDLKARIESEIPLTPVGKEQDRGPARSFTAPGWAGRVSFISPISDRDFCGPCNRVRLTSEGRLRGCLLNENEADFRAALRRGVDDEHLATMFRRVVREKPQEHPYHRELAHGEMVGPVQGRAMHRIGG
jgi:cyclic pyranopterin phosphate synthase